MKPDAPPINVTDLIGFKLLRLSNTLGLAAEREYIRDFGITTPEWRCLSLIATRSPLVAADIVAALHCDKAWVSRVLSRLQARTLIQIEPDPDDGRRQLLHATRKGLTLSDTIMAAANRRHLRLLDTLGAPERRAFLDTLDRLQIEAEKLL